MPYVITAAPLYPLTSISSSAKLVSLRGANPLDASDALDSSQLKWHYAAASI